MRYECCAAVFIAPYLLPPSLFSARRKAFDSDLVLAARAANSADPVSLLMIDIDRFKKINDTHGHPVGDEVLIGCATVVNSRSRHKGYAYRYGGEEIVVLVRNFTAAEALALAETIRSNVSKSAMSSKSLSVTVSIGVATLPDHATGPQELLKAADRAMYVAKHSGRNRVHSAGESGGTPVISSAPARNDEQADNLLASVDLTPRLEQESGQH